VNIPGATGKTYTAQPADSATHLRVRVVATEGGRSSVATSRKTDVVT
jgi:hypothetical protein